MLVVVDSPGLDPDELREDAIGSEFRDVEIPGDALYKRVAVKEIPSLVCAVKEVMREDLSVVGTAYRLNYGQEMPNTRVHADVGYGDYACVLYLTLPRYCMGGTAFWRNKASNMSMYSGGGTDDWDKEEAWEMQDMVSMKYGRLVIYPTNLFHSRWPWRAFGSGIGDGRLIAVGFFRRA